MNGELHTGEYKSVFGTPIKTSVSLYPAGTKVTDELFGKDASVDAIASSTKLKFDKNTLIFLLEPTGDYSKIYDYSISAISPSINSTTYGLKRRI